MEEGRCTSLGKTEPLMMRIMWQYDIIDVACFIDACLEKCTHQLALAQGPRHLISPELAGKDAVIHHVTACQSLRESRLWLPSYLAFIMTTQAPGLRVMRCSLQAGIAARSLQLQLQACTIFFQISSLKALCCAK